jgi:hypothetical protein
VSAEPSARELDIYTAFCRRIALFLPSPYLIAANMLLFFLLIRLASAFDLEVKNGLIKPDGVERMSGRYWLHHGDS